MRVDVAGARSVGELTVVDRQSPLAFCLHKRERDVRGEDKSLNFSLLARSNMGQFNF